MRDFNAHLTSLYVSERGRLQRQVARIIGCPVTAADLVHDLFLRLWDRTIDWTGDPTAYLTRSARNAAIDHLRSECVRAAYVADNLAQQQINLVPSPYDIAEARDSLNHVDEAIRGLPERTRHIFLLNRIHGCSYSEIAEALEVSSGAIEKQMMRALRTIRAAVERE
jgi:RNA polymerase sigma-70 factor (ECF subfamily)